MRVTSSRARSWKTLELVRGYDSRAAFVRGNADRAVLELANGTRHDPTDREQWMSAHHGTAAVTLLGSFSEHVVVEVDGLGGARLPRLSARRHRVRDHGDAGNARTRVRGRCRGDDRRDGAHTCAVRPPRGRHPFAQPGQCGPALRGTARCVLGAASSAGRSTTSPRRSRRTARRTIRLSSRWWRCSNSPRRRTS